ncbi:hypothetical protein ACIRSS_24050 [Amycolatopsis sp. NPDC101161]|uniref:hypothetical protein n=1 Tax=Amycolatopsis sp. NPDC101161 TaxID=3363940 RepID=UPI00380DE800
MSAGRVVAGRYRLAEALAGWGRRAEAPIGAGMRVGLRRRLLAGAAVAVAALAAGFFLS